MSDRLVAPGHRCGARGIHHADRPKHESTMDKPMRTVFFISDSTGITAETLGRSLLSQFESVRFRQTRVPFV
ncbi:MAG TPA: kinase/pyrophosphorylase, partial [Methyloversatilis sp.]